jgi:hypothetical protein
MPKTGVGHATVEQHAVRALILLLEPPPSMRYPSAMPRFVAFLRGVSPLNCQMSRLRDVLSAAGFKSVCTVLSSGNAAFDAAANSEADVERQLDELLPAEFGRGFFRWFARRPGWPNSSLATLSRRFRRREMRSGS